MSSAPALREKALQTYPGWRVVHELDARGEPHNARYAGPGGEWLTKHQFYAAVKRGEIVPAPDPEATPARSAASSTSTSPAGHAASSLGSSAPTDEPPAPVLDLPDAKPKKTPAGVASASELALTATLGLIILSSALSWLTKLPELTMSQAEAQGIAVPLANITAPSELNRRFGRYLAGSSDYTLLGYALYAYGYRVVGQLQQRAALQQAQQAAMPANRGMYAVAKNPAPAATAQPSAATAVGAAGADAQRGPASGGIAAAASGNDGAAAARIVGYNPL